MREKHETAVRPLPALPKPLHRKRRLTDAFLAGIDLLLRDPPALAGKMRHINGQFILKMHTYTPLHWAAHSCLSLIDNYYIMFLACTGVFYRKRRMTSSSDLTLVYPQQGLLCRKQCMI